MQSKRAWHSTDTLEQSSGLLGVERWFGVGAGPLVYFAKAIMTSSSCCFADHLVATVAFVVVYACFRFSSSVFKQPLSMDLLQVLPGLLHEIFVWHLDRAWQ